MAEVKTVTTEELEELKALRDESDRFVINLGQIQYQRVLLDAQEGQLKEALLKLKGAEKQVTDKLIDKYGNITVDIETGTIS
jgi:hypothetical protein